MSDGAGAGRARLRWVMQRVGLVLVAAFGLAALLLASASAATQSSGAFPGRNGLIAYVGQRFGGYNQDEGEIYLVRADGRGRRLVKRFNRYGVVAEPAWSPDGRLLAFQRQGGNDRIQVYLMTASGSGL